MLKSCYYHDSLLNLTWGHCYAVFVMGESFNEVKIAQINYFNTPWNSCNVEGTLCYPYRSLSFSALSRSPGDDCCHLVPLAPRFDHAKKKKTVLVVKNMRSKLWLADSAQQADWPTQSIKLLTHGPLLKFYIAGKYLACGKWVHDMRWAARLLLDQFKQYKCLESSDIMK